MTPVLRVDVERLIVDARHGLAAEVFDFIQQSLAVDWRRRQRLDQLVEYYLALVAIHLIVSRAQQAK